jgi:hypothetical protein
MSTCRCLSLVIMVTALGFFEEVSAQEKAKAPPTAQECLDGYFLNCDSLTANACELVSGSVTNTSGKDVLARDFVWFRAQKEEAKKKSFSYLEGRSFSPQLGPAGSFLERKLIAGDEGFYGLGSDPPMSAIDLTSQLPEGELEAYLDKRKRLTYSQYEFPEICPAALMVAAEVNPKNGTLSNAHALFGRMKLIGEYKREPLLVGIWRLDGKMASGVACARIMFDRKQGYMPTYVEWRQRDTDSKTDPNDSASYVGMFNVTETKWSKVPKKGHDLWAPVRVVNKRIGKTSGQEWVIEATWRIDALQEQYFDVAKINGDRDGNPIAKIRRHMQSAADKTEKDASADKAGVDKREGKSENK